MDVLDIEKVEPLNRVGDPEQERNESHDHSTSQVWFKRNYVPGRNLESVKSCVFNRSVLIPDIEDPKAYRKGWKWCITILVSAAAAIDSITTNIFYPALPEVPGDLHTNPAITNLCVALPTVSSGIFPLYWSYASEKFGRRYVYLISVAACVIFSAVAAISSSIGMLTIIRTLGAGAGCAVTSIGAAVVADVWEVEQKGRAMSAYYVGILLGPALGPVIGGLLVQRWGWRATQWFQMAYAALILILIFVLLPDTSRKISASSNISPSDPQTSSKGDISLPSALKSRGYWLGAFRPLRIVLYLRNPGIAITIYLASITFLVTKAFQVSIQQSFASFPYNFNAISIGVAFLPFALGLIVGDLAGGKWSDHVMNRTAMASNRYDRNGEILFAPEDRLKENAWLAVLCLPGALAWYGWSIHRHSHWIIPMVGEVFIGLSVGLIFSLVTTFLVETIPHRSASLVALNGLGRNLFATIGTAIAQPVQTAIGSGWLFTILAAITLASPCVILPMKKYGEAWRGKLTQGLRENGQI